MPKPRHRITIRSRKHGCEISSSQVAVTEGDEVTFVAHKTDAAVEFTAASWPFVEPWGEHNPISLQEGEAAGPFAVRPQRERRESCRFQFRCSSAGGGPVVAKGEETVDPTRGSAKIIIEP